MLTATLSISMTASGETTLDQVVIDGCKQALKLFGSNRPEALPLPDVSMEVSNGAFPPIPGSISPEEVESLLNFDLVSAQEFFAALDGAHLGPESALQDNPDPYTTLDPSAQNDQAIFRLSRDNGLDGMPAYFRHRDDGLATTHDHNMAIWRRGQFEAPDESYENALKFNEDVMDEMEAYPETLDSGSIEGLEAMMNYLYLTQVKRAYRLNDSYFFRQRTEGERTFRYSETGFPLYRIDLDFSQNEPADGGPPPVLTSMSVGDTPRNMAEFEALRISYFYEFRRAFGIVDNPLEIFLNSTQSTMRRLKNELRAAGFNPYSLAKLVVSNGWRLFTGFGSAARGFVRGVRNWAAAKYRRGGTVHEIMQRQAMNRFRLRIFIETLKKRQTILGFRLTEAEEAHLARAISILENPELVPSSIALHMASGIILQDERNLNLNRGSLGNTIISLENRTRSNNNDFESASENLHSSNRLSVWSRLMESPAGRTVTTSVMTAILTVTAMNTTQPVVDTVDFILTENPQYQYTESLISESIDNIWVEYLGFSTTPATRTAIRGSSRGFGFTETLVQHITEERLRRFADRAALDPNYNPLQDPEYQEARDRVLAEVVVIREADARALIFMDTRTQLINDAIPDSLTAQMREIYLAKNREEHPGAPDPENEGSMIESDAGMAQAEAINELFDIFIRNDFDTNSPMIYLSNANESGTLSPQMYADLMHYFQFGYARSYYYYFNDARGSLLHEEGMPYTIFGRAPGLIQTLKADSGILGMISGNDDPALHITSQPMEVFVVEDNPMFSRVRVEFVDTSMLPAMEGENFYVDRSALE